jgi:AsmA protein
MAVLPQAAAPKPSRRWRRVAARGLGLIVGLLVVGGVVVALRGGGLDPDAYKPEIEAAVLRATGRTLTIGGQLRIGLFNGPRIKATDVALSNAPGGSRPQMVTVGEVKARLSLMALLTGRIEIERLELIRPDLLLEIDAAGQPNWRFIAPPRASAETEAPAGASRPHRRLVVRDLLMTDGAAALLDDRTGQRIALGLKTVTAALPADDAPLTFGVTATVGDTDLKLTGTVGRPAAPDAAPDGTAAAPKAWPVTLELSALGALATLTGTVDAGALASTPGPGRYDLALTASVQDLSSLAPLLPGVTLPAVKDLHLKLAAAGARGALPELRQLDLSAGHSDLTALVPGLVVDQISIVDASAEQPVQARAAGSYGGADFALSADLGAPAALRPGLPERGPFPITFTATGAGARLTAKGGILHPRDLQGLDLAVEAQVADVGAFAPLLHRALPALKDLSGRARITDGADGLRRGVSLGGLHVTTPGTDASGDLTLDWAPRPSVAGHVTAASLNAGDLVSAFANPINPPPVLAAPGAPAAPAPPAAAPTGPRHLLSDRPIRFDRWLAGTDADLRLDAATVTWPDEVWRNFSGHLLLAAGRLRLDKLAADLPAGHSEATLDLDATKPAPAVALTVRSPGVSVRPLLALLGLPQIASGRLEVDANLHGAGSSAHAIAAGLDGSLGLAMVGGSVDGGAGQAWLAELLRRAALPDGARLSGRTRIDCLALRLDLAHGLGTLRAAALQTPLLSLTGSGAVNLAEETVAMRVRALASVGIGIAVPFDVSGPLRSPSVRVNIAGGATSALEGAAGLVIGRLEGEHGAAGLEGPTCAGELATARGGWAGPVPTAASLPARPAPAPSRPVERAARAFRWLLP